MPRNAAGTYTLPLPPVVTDTTITTNFENSTDNDLAAEITNSLDRNGRGGMLAPFKIFDGTQAAPGLAFTLEPGTGLYRIGAGDVGLSITGTKVMEWTVGGVTVPVGINASLGGALFVNSNANPGDYVQIIGQPAGALNVTIGAGGVDASINITLAPKGTGGVLVNANALTVQKANAGGPIDLVVQNTDFGAGSQARFLMSVAGVGAGTVLMVMHNTADYWSIGRSAAANASLAFAPTFDLTAPVAILQRNGTFGIFGAFQVQPTQPIYLDGGGDSFIAETSANVVDIIVGGSNSARFLASGVAVQSLDQLWLDGGGDTYFRESAANQVDLIVGNTLSTRFYTNGLTIQPGGLFYLDGGANTYIKEIADDIIGFFTGGFERGRITANGYLKISPTGVYTQPVGLVHELRAGTNDWTLRVENAGGPGPFGLIVNYLGTAPNGVGSWFYYGLDTVGQKYGVASNGGIYNVTANNVNLSDVEVKEYIEPLTPVTAAQLWNAHRDVNWCSFRLVGQTHDDPNFGYLAQDIADKFANVMPWLVDEVNWGTPEKPLMRKSVYETDLKNVGHAVLSEAQRRIEALELAISDYVKQ
jgi:hypothetical protein